MTFPVPVLLPVCGMSTRLWRHEELNSQVKRSVSRLFRSSPVTGPWKNALSTECIRVWSPGARVGHAYVNVEEMNGTLGEASSDGCAGGNGTARGTLGFEVAEVGRGGSARMSGVSPGIRRATTFVIVRGF